MPRSQALPRRRRSRADPAALDLQLYPPAFAAIVVRTLASFAPPPTLTVSQWADQERRLSSEASAEPGQWETSRAEYLRGVMDSLTDPGITRVVVAKGSQVGYTEALNNVLGYYIDQDPAPILIVEPSLELAEAWSKDRLSPMLRDTRCLTDKVSSPLTRDSGNTLRQKVFPGGRLAIVGANSPAGLASRPVRIVIADEIDRFPLSAGSEGDPLALAAKRQATFWNRKTLLGSTPTLLETSVIWREWLASDQRRYFVPCDACGHEQHLVWANVHWDKTDTGKHLPHTAVYVCESCGSVWSDADRHDAVAKGRWIATNPDVIDIAGFHIPGFLSPWLSLADITKEFLAARKDAALLQVWTNTTLGEPFETRQETIEGSSLLRRGEAYGPASIPEAVRLLVAGCDVQGDRLEVTVMGFGAYEETWMLRHEVLPGDPTQGQVWESLIAVLTAKYHTDSGREMRVRASCVDTGGHHQHAVLSFCRNHRGLRVFPIKGMAGPRRVWPPRASRTKNNEHVHMIGVDTAKDVVYSRLRIDRPGPGYIHFPVGGAFDAEYFSQLTSEAVQTRFKEGRPYRVWVLPAGRRNEALDCAVYCLAARDSTRIAIIPPRGPDVAPAPADIAEPEPSDHEDPDPDTRHRVYAEAHARPGALRPAGWVNSNKRGSWFDRNY